jgi:hypothetical protein
MKTWKVYNGKRFIGIIESNYDYAITYWKTKGYTLKPYNDNHLEWNKENS